MRAPACGGYVQRVWRSVFFFGSSLAVLAWWTPAHGQEPAPIPGVAPEAGPAIAALRVSRADAARWGATRGPGVRAAREPLSAAREAAGSATRFTRAPQLTLTGGYRSSEGSGGPELGVALSQDIPLENVGALRSEVAGAWSQQARSELRQVELDAATRALLAWATCLEAEALLRVRRQAVAQAEEVLRLGRARVEAGAGLPSDEALARSDAAVAGAAVMDAEGRLAEAYAELGLAIGQPAGARLVAVGELEESAPPGPSTAPAPTTSGVAANPALASAQARARQARSQTRLLEATLGPSFAVGAAYLREGGGAQVVTGFVGLPLPFVNPTRFDVARERAVERRAEAEVAAVQSELAKELHVAARQRSHWRQVRDGLKPGLTAALEAQRVSLANFEAGTHDISPVLAARQRVIAVQEQLAHVAGEIVRADIRYRALTGALPEGVAR